MKNKSLKIVFATAFSVTTVLALSSVGAVAEKVNAETVYPATLREYDGTYYSGYEISADNVGTFSQTVDLTNSDLETPIFQFMITPYVRGIADLKQLVFTFSDKNGKTLSVGFIPRDDWVNNEYLCGLAAGDNQTLLGEHQSNYVDLANGDGAYLNTIYAGISPYTFKGYSVPSSSNFCNTNGAFEADKNGIISIYYSAEENAIYADSGFNWVDDDPTKEWTLTDKYTLSKTGQRRFRIRDLDYAEYKKSGAVIKDVWSGFEDPSNVTCSVSFDAKTDNPSILLFSLGGKQLAENYYVKSLTSGVVGQNFPIPNPYYFSNLKQCDFNGLGGTYTVKDSSGATVVASSVYTEGCGFVPTNQGVYNIEYVVVNPDTNQPDKYVYPVTVLNEGGTTLTLNAIDRNYLLNEEIDLGFEIDNNVQVVTPEVYLTIKKDNAVLVPESVCAKNFTYKVTSAGNYEFIYKTTDMLGQITEKRFVCFVSDYAIKANSGVMPTMLYLNTKSVPLPSSNDYGVVDVNRGNAVVPSSVGITVKKGNGEFSGLTINSFNEEGEYTVKYDYLIEDNHYYVTRLIKIFASLPKISVSDVPQNTKLLDGQDINNDSFTVKALNKSSIGFPLMYFTSDADFAVQRIFNGEIVDCTADFETGYYIFKPQEVGVYCFSAVSEFGDGYVVRKNVFIDVREKWFIAVDAEDITENVGKEITVVYPEIKNFNGTSITDGTFVVTYNGTAVDVDNGKFTPIKLGVYTVIYTVEKDGEKIENSYNYNIVDNEKPMIHVSDINVNVGEFISFDDLKITDNFNGDLQVEYVVQCDGKKLNVYNNGFSVAKNKVYKVTVTVTDMSGNIATANYKVTSDSSSTKKGCGGNIIGLPAVVMALLSVTLIIAKKKRNN